MCDSVASGGERAERRVTGVAAVPLELVRQTAGPNPVLPQFKARGLKGVGVISGGTTAGVTEWCAGCHLSMRYFLVAISMSTVGAIVALIS